MNYCKYCNIAYEGRDCPLCDIKSSLESADEEIIRQEKTIESLNDRIVGLEDIIANLKESGPMGG
jgi:hypothetical protein